MLPENQGRIFQQRRKSADCQRGRRKGPTSKNVKNCQKVSKSFRHFSTIFAQGKKRQTSSKASTSFSTLFDNFRAAHHFSGPFWGPLRNLPENPFQQGISDSHSLLEFSEFGQKSQFYPPKGPFGTKNTATIAKIVNYYSVVFLLRPPDLLHRPPFPESENVCNSQENGVPTRCAAIVNHSAIVKRLRVVNLLRVVFLVRRGPLGSSIVKMATNNPDDFVQIFPFLGFPQSFSWWTFRIFFIFSAGETS